jgi:adenylate kinase
MFRAFSHEDSPVARRVKEVVDSGKLLPPWIAIYLFHRELFKQEEGARVILDGFPRKLAEAKVIVDTLSWFERPFRVLYLRTDADTVVDRIEKRFSIEHRKDDEHPDERMREYEKHTHPALEFLEAEGVVISIDGEQSVEKVHADILEKVRELS